jgi:hypothetical protein
MDFSKVINWLNQTSTRGALITVGMAAIMVVLGVSPEAVIPLALPTILGLVISDKATASQVAAAVQPALQAIAAHPTMDTAKAQAAGALAAMLPTIESKAPADMQTAIAAASLIVKAEAAKPV